MNISNIFHKLFKLGKSPDKQVAVDKFYSELLEKLEQHRLTSCKIIPCATEPLYPWSSKFGGNAYLPIGIECPKNSNSFPLRLLAQISFDELPVLEGLPKNGLLQFFIEEDDGYGLDFDRPLDDILKDPQGYRVLFHPNPAHDLSDWQEVKPPTDNDSYFPIGGEYSLKFEIISELPAPTDYRFDKYADLPQDMPDELFDAVYDRLDASGSKIGGFANFTQDDPRKNEEDSEWLLLLQIDSESTDDVEIMWGDVGVANFFIKEGDLKNHDFRRVWYNWDCC